MKTKATLLTLALSGWALNLFAQGTVVFYNLNLAADLRAPIYGPNPSNVREYKTGNSQAYAGALLAGSGYMAQLFSAPGANAVETSLAGSAGSITTFRTGTAAGYFAPVTATLANVPKDAAAATLQVRAWDNSSGLCPMWAQAEQAWFSGLIAAGKSAMWNLNAIGGDVNTLPQLVGMQSFNIYIPEPSTSAVLALGGLGLWLCRRKK